MHTWSSYGPQAGDRAPFPCLQERYSERNGVFSPDGRWIAYVSDESGRNEVYVQAFPVSGEKRPTGNGIGSAVTVVTNWTAAVARKSARAGLLLELHDHD